MYYKKKQFKFYLDFGDNEEVCSGIVEAKDEQEAREKILKEFDYGLGIIEKEDDISLYYL